MIRQYASQLALSIGTYEINKNCFSCNSTCSSCSNNYSCDTCFLSSMQKIFNSTCICPENKVFNELTKSCECIQGYYLSKDHQKCYNCKPPCLDCNENNPILCKSCLKNYKLYRNSCICLNNQIYTTNGCQNCSQTQLINSNQTICYECNQTCKSCHEENPNLCTECNPGFQKTGNFCYCPKDSYFKIDKCIKCDPLKRMKVNKDKTGCYYCNESCQDCDENSPKNCTKCPKGFLMINETSECVCEEGKYKEKWNKCSSCLENCKVCKNKSKCIECNSLYKKTIKGDCERNCNDSEYLDGDICKSCGKYCLSCNSQKCLMCKPNSTSINETDCECLPGFAGNNECEQMCFYKIEVEHGNILNLKLEKPLRFNLTENDFLLKFIPNVSIRYHFSIKSSNLYIFRLIPEEDIIKGTSVLLEVKSTEILKSDDGYILKKRKFTNELYQYNFPYQSPKSIQVVSNSTKKIVQAAASSSILVGLLSNPACFWVLMNTLDIISFLPLNSVPYSTQLKEFLNSFGMLSLLPNPIKNFVSLDDNYAPYSEAKNYGFDTSLFHINAGTYLVNLSIFLLLIPILYIGYKLPNKFVSDKCKKWLDNYKFNFFLRFWIQSFLNLTIFACIQIKSVFFK